MPITHSFRGSLASSFAWSSEAQGKGCYISCYTHSYYFPFHILIFLHLNLLSWVRDLQSVLIVLWAGRIPWIIISSSPEGSSPSLLTVLRPNIFNYDRRLSLLGNKHFDISLSRLIDSQSEKEFVNDLSKVARRAWIRYSDCRNYYHLLSLPNHQPFREITHSVFHKHENFGIYYLLTSNYQSYNQNIAFSDVKFALRAKEIAFSYKVNSIGIEIRPTLRRTTTGLYRLTQ